MLKYFSITTPENSDGAENSPENSGSHAKNIFCSMYEMSQRHPVWVAENHVNPCNSVFTNNSFSKIWSINSYMDGLISQNGNIYLAYTEYKRNRT